MSLLISSSQSLSAVAVSFPPRRSPHMSASQVSQLSHQPPAYALTNGSYRAGVCPRLGWGPLTSHIACGSGMASLGELGLTCRPNSRVQALAL